MKNGKEGVVREIMMGSPVTLKPDETLDLANDVISLGANSAYSDNGGWAADRIVERKRYAGRGVNDDLRT
jgi:hypothetical protein